MNDDDTIDRIQSEKMRDATDHGEDDQRGLTEPEPDECCGKCRVWWSFGKADEKGLCQRNPPVIVDAVVRNMIAEAKQQWPDDPVEVDSDILHQATCHPVTWRLQWCSQFERVAPRVSKVPI